MQCHVYLHNPDFLHKIILHRTIIPLVFQILGKYGFRNDYYFSL